MEEINQEYLSEIIQKKLQNQRKWTDEEVKILFDLREQGISWKEIAKQMDRTLSSVKLKYKRTLQKEGKYNNYYLGDKHENNKKFIEMLSAKSVLDVYAGEKSYYKELSNLKVISNDIEYSKENTYCEDAFKLLCKIYSEVEGYEYIYKFDVVDLDPYGSAFDCFDLAIRLAKKGLIITFGEMGHKRWKRLDFVNRYYGINSLDDFTIENLINRVKEIGYRQKKELTPVIIENNKYNMSSRVYFKISPKTIGYDIQLGER